MSDTPNDTATSAEAAADPQVEPGTAHLPQAMADAASLRNLSGRGVIVTRGVCDVGQAVVREFLGHGCAVGFLDADEAAGQALAAGLEDAHFQCCDPANVAALLAAIATLVARLGNVDVLVDVAAADQRHSLEAVTPQLFDDRIALNLRSSFFAAQSVVSPMRERGGGAIVNVVSERAEPGAPGWSIDAACASAVIGLTRGLADELRRDGIRVNCVLPGASSATVVDASHPAAAGTREPGGVRLIGAPPGTDEIARMVAFLADDAARTITGQAFRVDAQRT